LRFWRPVVRRALHLATTPCYVFAAEPVAQVLATLVNFDPGLPVRHWFSCKTQPLPPLLRWWQRQQRPVEIVSEFEYLAARQAGFPPSRILANGPAKHAWLPRHDAPGLHVNFDSTTELRALLPAARSQGWRLGIRLLTPSEHNPEHPGHPTQFGMAPDEARLALNLLRKQGLKAECLHFHLRTNIPRAAVYERALRQAASFCQSTRFQPSFLDCGGGWPPAHTRSPEGRPFSADWELRELEVAFHRTLPLFPALRELWLENGRYLTASSGVLAITILDVKQRRGLRQLICDGGRTQHALVSTWEQHALHPLKVTRGRDVETAVYGPTCMAFDRLALTTLPASLDMGDRLLWLDAGAYHLPWETRFSHGLAAVVWHEDGRVALARKAESLEDPSRWIDPPSETESLPV
jgi:diaminopimelate decarboxylase